MDLSSFDHWWAAFQRHIDETFSFFTSGESTNLKPKKLSEEMNPSTRHNIKKSSSKFVSTICLEKS